MYNSFHPPRGFGPGHDRSKARLTRPQRLTCPQRLTRPQHLTRPERRR